MLMFKFLTKNRKGEIVSVNEPNTVWEPGEEKELPHRAIPVLCKSGYHASDCITTAAVFASGQILAVVGGLGDVVGDEHKKAFSRMLINKYWELDDEFLRGIVENFLSLKYGYKVSVPQSSSKYMLRHGPIPIKNMTMYNVDIALRKKLACLDKYEIINDIAIFCSLQPTANLGVLFMLEREFSKFLLTGDPEYDINGY